jgi:hypothetical protein
MTPIGEKVECGAVEAGMSEWAAAASRAGMSRGPEGFGHSSYEHELRTRATKMGEP